MFSPRLLLLLPALLALAVPAFAAAPVAKPDTVYIPSDSPSILIQITGGEEPLASDPDGEPLTISITTQPTRGTARVLGTGVLYTPTTADTFVGDDSFVYQVTDPTGASASAKITIQNNAPVAVADGFPVARTGPTRLNVLANDRDEERSELRITAFPAQIPGGTLRRVGPEDRPQLEFTPNSSFTGVTEFSYTIRDGHGKTATARVKLFSGQVLVQRSIGALLEDAAGKAAGFIRIDSLVNGAFTARIELGSKKFRLMGSFNANGRFVGFAHDEDGGALPVSLTIALNESGAPAIRASVAAGEFTSEQTLGTVSVATLFALKGRYTVQLPVGGSETPTDPDEDPDTDDGDTDDGDGDDGDGDDGGSGSSQDPDAPGWMAIDIDERGNAFIKGEAGDARSFSARAVVSGTDDAPELIVYATPREGILAGTLKLGETISGDFFFSREPSDTDFYPDGFELALGATGARWDEPEDGQNALENGEFTISITGGNVGAFSHELSVSDDDDLEVLDPGFDNIVVRIRRKDGTFSGAFSNPDDENHHIKFSGVLVRGTGGGAGVFEGKDKAGAVTISGSAETDDETTTE